MENNQIANHSSGIRKTQFNCLKDEQCVLNMQIRLAMQLHNRQVQEELEKNITVEHLTKCYGDFMAVSVKSETGDVRDF